MNDSCDRSDERQNPQLVLRPESLPTFRSLGRTVYPFHWRLIMASVRSGLSRMKRWMKGDKPRDGPGPGGGPNSDSYNRARAEGEFINIRDTAGGGGFS